MKIFGNRELNGINLLDLIFRKGSRNITLKPSESTVYTADRSIELPAGDSDVVLASTADIGNKVTANSTITGDTKTKITYDSKGLVTAGADLATSDIPSGIDAAKIADGSVSNTEFQHLEGVTSSIQTQLNSKQGSLGFTPENIANKGQANGYAPLNSSSKLENSFLSTDFTNPANITQSADYRFVTDTEKSTWNGKEDALGFTPEDVANKGQASGYVPLNASSKIDNIYLDTTVMNYHGTWDASTNTPLLGDGMVGADPGDVYVVSIGGTQDLGSGSITFSVGDWVIYSQTNIWEHVDNSSAVTSVNGAQGAVTVDAINELTGDITAGPASGSESKAATIAAGAVIDSKIAANANIAVSKLASGGPGQVLKTVNGTPTWSAESGAVASVNGNTGAVTVNAISELTGDITAGPASGSESKAATIAAGAVDNSKISASANIAVSKLAAGTDNYVLKTVSGVPTWSAESGGGGGGVPNPTTMTDIEATRLGYKTYISNTAYNAGVIPSIVSSFTGDTSVTAARFIPYQTQDGAWRLKGFIPVFRHFYPNLGTAFGLAGSQVNATAIQSDGKILVGGSFTTFNGQTRNRLVRLNSDGSEDTAFYTNLGLTGFNNEVSALALQSNGKILVGGSFTTLNGITRNRLVRLNSDGSIDLAFSSTLGTGFGGQVQNIIVQPSDDKILVSGSFTSPRIGFTRLNSDGAEDSAFHTTMGTGPNSACDALALQSDGKIIVAGQFTTWSGITRGRFTRLNSNGSEDSTFVTNTGSGANGIVRSVAVRSSDGKIFLGGGFTSWNGAGKNGFFTSLNTNGTDDITFYNNYNVGVNSTIRIIVVQSDGKVLMGGDFTSHKGSTRNRILRLNSDGTEDSAFATNIAATVGFNNSVFGITIQSDGKILIGGSYTTYNSATRNCLTRFNSSGAEDGPVTSMTYTINGVTFASFAQLVSSDRASGPTTASSNVITLNSNTVPSGAQVFASLPGGAIFDVELASKPTWAY